MQRFLAVLFFFFVAFFSFSQEERKPRPLDTLETKLGDVVLFSDKSWEYIDFLEFDGITNLWLHESVNSDTAVDLKICWDNSVCFSYPDNPVHTLRDTLWMCVIDDTSYCNYAIPHSGKVTSKFGKRGRRFHYGVDINLDEGDSVYSAFDGIVRYTRYNTGGYGNLVIIRHYNGLETFYAHLSDVLVTDNQKVTAGQIIGLGGNTGRSFGAHLHFEVRFYDQAIDPELVFDFENNILAEENLLVHKDLFDYNGLTASVSNSRVTSTDKSSSSSVGGSEARFHKVRSGDSLYGISLKYRTTVDSLCKLNNITPESILHIGQIIKLK